MEIRSLRYFLAAAREENMTRAAEQLHVTQPTLSKALKALEDELGKKLFTRRSFSIRLTDEGVLLRNRAEDLVTMADKIEKEFLALDDVTGGELYFGLAESWQIRHLARELKALKAVCPGLQYHITSGDTEQVTEKLDKGLLDFAVLCDTPDAANTTACPSRRRTSGASSCPRTLRWQKEGRPGGRPGRLSPVHLRSRAGRTRHPGAGERVRELRLEGSSRLAYNASLFVREGLGYQLSFEHLVDTSRQRPGVPPAVAEAGIEAVPDLEQVPVAHPDRGAVYKQIQ